MNAASFQVRQVLVRRSGRTVLDIDTLDIEPGQWLNLIGPNGAGKTTLLQVLSGLIRPVRGQVRMDGIELTGAGAGRHRALRRRIGYVPQSARYNADLPVTVEEVVAMGRVAARGLFRRLTARDRQRIDHWLETLELTDRRRQTFRSLSGGERQKALIARAMAQQPAVLMLDEPTSHLDWQWKRQLLELLGHLHRRHGLTVILISHELAGLPLDTGCTALLQHGKLISHGPGRHVLNSPHLRRIYGPLPDLATAGDTP